MVELEDQRKPTRDYRSYSDTPWALWDVVYSRRSHRKYLSTELGEGLEGELSEVAMLSQEARGVESAEIRVVCDGAQVEEIRNRSHRGLKNKVNLWLARTPVAGFLVMIIPERQIHEDRPSSLAKASVAMEDCVLWLTEAGLGSCWIAGVNKDEVRDILGLGDGASIPAIVSFGAVNAGRGSRGYDRFTYRTLSRRRKPLRDIAYLETTERPYRAGDLRVEGFSADPVQDVRGLLGRLGVDRGSECKPLDLAVEACLEAARMAPSAGNYQGWSFVVIKDRGRLERLGEICGGEASFRAAVLGAGNARSINQAILERPFWMIDAAIAASHQTLMAASMGCGVSLFIDGIDEKAANKLAGLPPGVRTVSVAGIS